MTPGHAADLLIQFTREEVATAGDVLRDPMIAEALVAAGYRRLATIEQTLRLAKLAGV